MSTDRKISKISIIIPTLNEAETIGPLLSLLEGIPGTEVIVVDGGSNDGTASVAEKAGVRVIKTAAGRALQLNKGAEAAGGEIFLFLHCDTRLPPGFAEQVRETAGRPGVATGAFSCSIDGSGVGFRVLERLINFRSRVLQMPYGDQALFMTREMFSGAGGFPLQPVMEDFELVRRLKRRGRVSILSSRSVTSARRWKRGGILKTTAVNQAIIICYLLGVSPERLAGWYRRG